MRHQSKYHGRTSFSLDYGTHCRGQHARGGQILGRRYGRCGLKGKVFRTNQTVFSSEFLNKAVMVGCSPAVIVNISETKLFYRMYKRTDNFFVLQVTFSHLGKFKCQQLPGKVGKFHVEEIRCTDPLLHYRTYIVFLPTVQSWKS